MDRVLEFSIEMETLRRILSSIAVASEEALFRVSEHQFECNVTDPAHVFMARIILDHGGSFECQSPPNAPTDIPVDINLLQDYVKNLPSTCSELKFTYHEARGLRVRSDATKRIFRLLEGVKWAKVPTLNYDAYAVLPASTITMGMKQTVAITDHVVVMIDADTFRVWTNGDSGAFEMIINKDQLETHHPDAVPRAGMYSLDFLTQVIKTLAKDDTVTVSLHDAYPVVLETRIDAGRGTIRFLIAPRDEPVDPFKDPLDEDPKPKRGRKAADDPAKAKKQAAEDPAQAKLPKEE